MRQPAVETYIKERIDEFEKKLALIESCTEKEICKPLEKRSFNILYVLHWDRALYELCLSELNTIREKLQ